MRGPVLAQSDPLEHVLRSVVYASRGKFMLAVGRNTGELLNDVVRVSLSLSEGP